MVCQPQNTVSLSDLLQVNRFVASGLFQNAWMVNFDNDGIVSSTLTFPFFEETKDFSETPISSLYLSTLTTIRSD